jgi:hypothetical protein
MKSIILHATETYPDLIAYVSTNNFGDQIITVIREYRDGTKETLLIETNQEGEHVRVDKKTLLAKVS